MQNNPIEYVTKYLTDNAKDFIGFKPTLLLKDAKHDPIKRATVIKDIVETIAVIPDPIYRATYIKECSRTLEMPEQTLTNEVNKILRAKYHKQLGLDSAQTSYPSYESHETSPSYQPQQQPEDTTPIGFFQEQELVKLLLAHGSETLEIEGKDDDDNDIVYNVTIASLIIDDLKNDGLLFRDPTHKKIFDAFDRGLDTGNLPTAQDFTSSEDQDVAVLAANLLSTQYKLDDWQRHRIVVKTEDDVMKKTVLTSILRFKDMVIEDRRSALVKELQTCTDLDDQLILLQKKKKLDDIRTRINRDLGIVITK